MKTKPFFLIWSLLLISTFVGCTPELTGFECKIAEGQLISTEVNFTNHSGQDLANVEVKIYLESQVVTGLFGGNPQCDTLNLTETWATWKAHETKQISVAVESVYPLKYVSLKGVCEQGKISQAWVKDGNKIYSVKPRF